MQIEKAHESLRAAELCFGEKLYNSTANRAYYAMFQAAVVVLARAGIQPKGDQWSHENLQAAFATELIHRRKLYPRTISSFLPNGMRLRHQADYYERPVSEKRAREILQWAQEFLRLVEER